MLMAIRNRLGRKEEGFTLIELMVVVLIIAILIAIAVPTFLGARQKAQNRAAQSNLRNALVADKTYYTDKETFVDDSGGLLKAIEPSLTFGLDVVPATVGTVYVAISGTGADTVLMLGVKSASGTCFYMKDTPTTASAGTLYGTDPACAKPSAATVASTSW